MEVRERPGGGAGGTIGVAFGEEAAELELEARGEMGGCWD